MTPKTIKRVPCEVFSRVTGYYRPVQNYNDAQKAQYFDRVTYSLKNVQGLNE